MKYDYEWEYYPKEYKCIDFENWWRPLKFCPAKVYKCQEWIKSEISIMKWIVTQPKFICQKQRKMLKMFSDKGWTQCL